jgi:cytochrome P450
MTKQGGLSVAVGTIPRSNMDIFSDEVLLDPYPHYKELRDLGPVVYLEQHDIFALARYEQVRAALVDWQTFSSAAGIGFNIAVNQLTEGNVESSDPPEHDRVRAILMQWLSPSRIRAFTDDIEQRADRLIAALVERRHCDAIVDLARAFPSLLVTELVGMSEDVCDKMIDWGDATFQCCGPFNERAEAGFPVLEDLFADLMSITKDDLKPGSVGRAIFEAVESGEVAEDDAFQLLWDYTGPSVDTTIGAIGSAILRFSEQPDQWELVCDDPSLLPAAANEVLRIDAPLTVLSRFSQREWESGGASIPAKSRVAVMFAAANRDERHYPDPDRFDVRRNPKDHLGFGFGIHHCVGQSLARAEIQAVLRALSSRVRRIEAGEPVWHLNNTMRTLKSLPVELVAR